MTTQFGLVGSRDGAAQVTDGGPRLLTMPPPPSSPKWATLAIDGQRYRIEYRANGQLPSTVAGAVPYREATGLGYFWLIPLG